MPPNFLNFTTWWTTVLQICWSPTTSQRRRRTALEYAAELSNHFGSTIHLISVETPAEYARIMDTEPRVREHVHEDIRRAFDNIEKRLQAKAFHATPHTVSETCRTSWKGRHWKARLICSCSVPLATVPQTVRNLGQPLNTFCELPIARCLRSGLMRFSLPKRCQRSIVLFA